jgi:nucleoside 2-deoxyribosyltransferase
MIGRVMSENHMSKPRVYLAGPISGLSYEAAQDWRKMATRMLAPDIACFSPLRCKQFLAAEGILEGSYEHHPLATSRGIMTRDHNDCLTADLLLVNLLGTQRVSIGTCMEIAWAHAYRKPVVLVMEEGNVHDHPMVNEATGYRLGTLAEATLFVKAILLP